MHNNTIIEVKNLKYKYRVSRRVNIKNEPLVEFKEALKGISFGVSNGEKISIIGPNGAGKSTLLLNIAGLLDSKYREGNIKIYCIEINEKNIFNIREKIGFVFQDPNDQLFSTTVFDDVSFGLVNFLVKKKDPMAKDIDFIKDKVKLSLAKVNLFNIENESPYFLSFGEKKLVALATVLSYDPEIFILDEPSSNLDPANIDNFINLLKEINKTVIVATHNLDMAYEFSERTIIINNGLIVYDGNTKEVLQNKELLEKNNLRLPFSLKYI